MVESTKEKNKLCEDQINVVVTCLFPLDEQALWLSVGYWKDLDKTACK